jgi:hypothetical protein
MMKKLALLVAVMLGVSGIASALTINVDVNDRPYYIHGPGYWVGSVYYVWVPGHWVASSSSRMDPRSLRRPLIEKAS